MLRLANNSLAICFSPMFSPQRMAQPPLWDGCPCGRSLPCPVCSWGCAPSSAWHLLPLERMGFPCWEHSVWMGAEGTTAHFGLLLDLLLDGKLLFLGKPLCLFMAENHRSWLKWPFLLPPALWKLGLSCPRAQGRAAPGLCPPMRASDGAQGGTGLRNSLLGEGPAHGKAKSPAPLCLQSNKQFLSKGYEIPKISFRSHTDIAVTAGVSHSLLDGSSQKLRQAKRWDIC